MTPNDCFAREDVLTYADEHYPGHCLKVADIGTDLTIDGMDFPEWLEAVLGGRAVNR